ncbi:hypothetical protein PVL29_020061 [Vitis rotundifolia]|uniref:Thioesterase domain-containing protein n=1 Tax=Vitis rotundifolia TaxID=103349 RepID=A0AA38Z227_VITRO|nr:hypothetical protein PVL29_020061 [Vitis rotundifolia]
MEKPTATDYSPPLTAATVWSDVPETTRSLTIDFFERQALAAPAAADCLRKDFYSHLIRSLLEVDSVERGRITCLVSVKPAVINYFGGLHGGAVAAIAELVSIACARTVVAEDKELFLGELGMSYLSAAQKNAELTVSASVVRSGRNVTVIAVEFKMRETSKLVYTARATFYNMPMAKL